MTSRRHDRGRDSHNFNRKQLLVYVLPASPIVPSASLVTVFPLSDLEK